MGAVRTYLANGTPLYDNLEFLKGGLLFVSIVKVMSFLDSRRYVY